MPHVESPLEWQPFTGQFMSGITSHYGSTFAD